MVVLKVKKEKILEALIESRKRIDTPDKWVQDRFGAVDKNNPRETRFTVEFKDCVSFCMYGALYSYLGVDPQSIRDDYDDLVVKSYGNVFREVIGIDGECDPISLPHWQDNPERTHAEIMDAFDKAITFVEGIAE